MKDLGKQQGFSIRVANNQADLQEMFKPEVYNIMLQQPLSSTSTSGHFVQMYVINYYNFYFVCLNHLCTKIELFAGK